LWGKGPVTNRKESLLAPDEAMLLVRLIKKMGKARAFTKRHGRVERSDFTLNLSNEGLTENVSSFFEYLF